MLQNKKHDVETMVRVNHAGEFGAKRIYEGQIAFLKNKETLKTVKHMKEQELKHLAYFENELVKRKVRPTALTPIWNIAGFALGAATALMGEKAAYACTVAVEEVIEEHYQEQLNCLSENESELKQNIEKFKAEETEHKEIGLHNDAEQTVGYEFLSASIKAGSRAAIWLSKRV
jgi:ubiquinone biosynthesis monooxygenase Coq7